MVKAPASASLDLLCPWTYRPCTECLSEAVGIGTPDQVVLQLVVRAECLQSPGTCTVG